MHNKCIKDVFESVTAFVGEVPVTSQLISMLFLHVPTPFKFFGMASGAVQRKAMIISRRGGV